MDRFAVRSARGRIKDPSAVIDYCLARSDTLMTKSSLTALPHLLLDLPIASPSVDFEACLNSVRNGSWGLQGAVDTNGNQVTSLSQATGLTYQLCLQACGSGTAAFDWNTFSQQFTSWLLPWLGLISQIPYGTQDGLSNFLAVVLTVGSPTLAAYSLALAVISNRWMVKRFQRSTYANSHLAAQILGNLQQVSLHLPDQAVVLPYENSPWWRRLADGLDYSVPKWTLASVMSVLYLALADIFTWITTLGAPLSRVQVNVTGESISSLWLCFLPIVIGNLQLSPKSDSDRICRALHDANSALHVASDSDRVAGGLGSLPIHIRTASRDAIEEDEICPAPIFFYARVFTWLHVTRKVADAFDAPRHAPNDSTTPTDKSQIEEYPSLRENERDGHSYEIFSIFLRSALLAIFLQWGTTGAAVMAIWYTPTEGLGCRSASYLLYGGISTLIWLLCVISSILAHSHSMSQTRTRSTLIIHALAIILRHTAKTLATLNAVWLFLCSLLQFSNLEDNCYCNSSVLGLHSKAYVIIEYTANYAKEIKVAWASGLLMSALTAGLFSLAIRLLRKHQDGQSMVSPS